MTHRLIATVAGAALAAGLAGAASAETVWKAGHSAAATEPFQTALEKLSADVKQCTGGSLVIEVYPNNQLGNEKEMIEGVLLGTQDIALPSNAVLTNFVGEMKVFDLPFLFRDRAHMYKVMDGPIADELSGKMEEKGFKLLGFFEAGIRHIMTSGKPVNSIDDLKGMKIRTMQNPIHVASFNAFGANATPIAYGELYGALQSGVVDGAEAANSNYEAKKFYEVAPNWAMVSWTALTVPVFTSVEKWKALSDTEKDCLAKGMAAAEDVERSAYAATDETKLKALKEAGVTVTTPDPGPFRTASQKVYDEFITSDDDKRRLKAIIDTK